MKILFFKIQKSSICEQVEKQLSNLKAKDVEIIDVADSIKLKNQHKVVMVPTLIKLDKKGKEIARITGVAILVELEKFLK